MPDVDVHVISDSARAATVLDAVRLRLLAALAQPDSAAGLARRLGTHRQQINYHLRLLEDAGFLTLVEERQQRGCTERVLQATARSYIISPAALGVLAADLHGTPDRLSSAYVLASAARIIREVGSLIRRAAAAGKQLATFTLETEVRFANPADQRAFADELTQHMAALVRKYHNGAAPGGRRFRFVVTGYPDIPESP